MATVSKQFFRGAASASEVTLYSVPAATSAVVTNVIVTNTSSSLQTVNLKLDGVEALGNVPIEANSVFSWDLKQALGALSTIAASASSTSVRLHISGVEIS